MTLFCVSLSDVKSENTVLNSVFEGLGEFTRERS